jgi:hypothetical protein
MTDADTIQRLVHQVAELRAEVNGLTTELTDLAVDRSAGITGEAGCPAVAGLRYERLEGWGHDYFLPNFKRPIGGEIRWCNEWQQHAEAITRLEALWRSWEHLRLDAALGMATWLTNHLDPQLAALHSRSGTFAQCQPERHA